MKIQKYLFPIVMKMLYLNKLYLILPTNFGQKVLMLILIYTKKCLQKVGHVGWIIKSVLPIMF